VTLLTAVSSPVAASPPPVRPESPLADPESLARIDLLMEAAMAAGDCPGGVVLVGRGEQILWRKAYGYRQTDPEKVPTTLDTIYDLASLTKVVATAGSVARLIDQGKVSLRDPAKRFIPELDTRGKGAITVEQLLIHRAGLMPDNPLSDYAAGPEEAWKRIYELPLVAAPGEEFIYTDVGYMLLGQIVQRVSGLPLDEFARREIFEPAGMTDTGFRPPEALRSRCAAQEKRNGRYIVGEVHDPRAYALGGVAGHAGLFSTADDLARFCRMILDGGRINGRRILSPLMVLEMTRPRPEGVRTGLRGLGFDVATDYSSCRGDLFPRYLSFGHTGFTGTSLWIDATTRTYVIILTNRLHPDGKGDVLDLRRKVATVVAAALEPSAFEPVGTRSSSGPAPPWGLLTAGWWAPGLALTAAESGQAGGAMERRSQSPAQDSQVLTGLDVLVREDFRPLAGRRIGLITNHTGLTRDGKMIHELLARRTDLRLVALFAPEHGFAGVLDEKVADSRDPATGLTIYSLYGKTTTPTDEMLQGIDALVFDIQDIGARFYTYVATMGNGMRAAARKGIPYFVLDRPNPITGLYVAGPLADPDKLGFTAFWRIPVAHGMTMGELATMFNREMGIGADLHVIRMENWRRNQWYDHTGLMWVNPSPNMRNLTQAMLYPGICLIEATNVSVGRGTDEPFERFGAPWIDARKLAAALNASKLEGVRFVPIEFTPTSSRHANRKCGGVHVLVTDRNAMDPVRVGITVAWQLRRLFGDAFEFDKVNNLLANNAALNALRQAADPGAVPAVWQSDLEQFRRIREKYLLYR